MIKKFDIFGTPINLNLNNDQKHKTKFGGIVTFMILTAITVSIYEFGKEIFRKEQPTTNYSQIYNENPEPYIFKKNVFPLVFSIMRGDTLQLYEDPSVYQVSMKQKTMKRQYNKETDGYDISYEYKYLKVEPCQQGKHFDIPELTEFYRKFEYTKETPYLCINIDDPTESSIEGEFNSDIYQALMLEFSRCNEEKNPNIKCKPQEEIDSILKLLYYDFFYPESLLDQSNLDNPFSLKGTNLFTIISGDNPKEAFLQLEYQNVISDTGFVLESFQKQSIIKVREYKELLNFADITKNNVFFTFELKLSPYIQHTYNRSYKKIPTVMAEMGGISKALLIIGFIICYPVSNLSMKQFLINKLYVSSHKLVMGDSQQIVEQSNEQNINIPVSAKDIQMKNKYNNKPIKSTNFKSNTSLQKSKNSEKKNNNLIKVITLKCTDYITYYKPKCFKRNTKQENIKNMCKEIEHSMDILYIQQKLHDIDKIKHLFMNEQQQKVFNEMPKVHNLVQNDDETNKIINSYRNKFQSSQIYYQPEQEVKQKLNIQNNITHTKSMNNFNDEEQQDKYQTINSNRRMIQSKQKNKTINYSQTNNSQKTNKNNNQTNSLFQNQTIIQKNIQLELQQQQKQLNDNQFNDKSNILLQNPESLQSSIIGSQLQEFDINDQQPIDQSFNMNNNINTNRQNSVNNTTVRKIPGFFSDNEQNI